MSARTPLIAGNWKLNLTLGESTALAGSLADAGAARAGREVLVAPVFTAIDAVARALRGSDIKVAAQDVYWEEQGAYTGEVSTTLLLDAGATAVIVGHSERRQLFGETDAGVNRKTLAVLRAGLLPIVCVGETLAEREAGAVEAVVGRQVRAALAG
ncbi:MAG TPA: triose-phosphate isomerase, partial [Candidatus Methanoperedens sp.]|nr:triose-phosphate isomerase [Candidatus Methanoperedens sp.]